MHIPLLEMFEELERELYWEKKQTPPSNFVELVTFYDYLTGAIIRWFQSGEWGSSKSIDTLPKGPWLSRVNIESGSSYEDTLSQLTPMWMMSKTTSKLEKERKEGRDTASVDT